MKNKILIPLIILGALAAFFSFKYTGAFEENAEEKKQLTLQTVISTLQRGHFNPRKLDDSFSAAVFSKTLSSFDYRKNFFTQQDVKALSKYKYAIDDQIKEGSLAFYNEFDKLFDKRLKETASLYKKILEKPFNFHLNDSVKLSGDDLEYPANDIALEKRWEKYLKYQTLSKYVDLKKAQEDKKKENKDAKLKSDKELEKEARESVRKGQDFFFRRLNKLDAQKRFSIYINAITSAEDPHTNYLPPEDKAKFDESMSGTFFGIGAQLQSDEGKTKVVYIIAGSPCWKQGELKVNDIILKVAQGDKEAVDIEGWDLEDVVKIIRGDKGTVVKLTVKKVDGSTRVIPITRGKVEREEIFAKSAIIHDAGNKIGYIYLPEFYADFTRSNGRRSAEDIAIEITKLKNAAVDGIILDLRNNGGGSLQDVVEMAGLFIDEGPIVQVKTNQGAPEKLYDRSKGTLYDGPLAIMVNQSSASASEIMAAAMQDYKRAVIVGSKTFGKGTVQRLISLDEMVKYSNLKNILADNGKSLFTDGEGIGSLKITTQKFYRINGGSTQLRGVTPDITLPDAYEHIAIGERRDKASLKWDEVPAVDYKIVDNPVNVAYLREKSNARVSKNPTFNLISSNAKLLKEKEQDNFYQLNVKKYREELEEAAALSKKMEDLEKEAQPLDVSNPQEDMARIKMDSSSIARNEDWLNAVKKDIYISETVHIINDLKSQNMKWSGKGLKE